MHPEVGRSHAFEGVREDGKSVQYIDPRGGTDVLHALRPVPMAYFSSQR